jgi:hypothetical protein
VAAVPSHWDSPLRYAANWEASAALLSEALTARGLLTYTTDDWDRALEVGVTVLNTLPQDHSAVPRMLFHLRAEPAQHRFTVRGELADLDLAIRTAETALTIAVEDIDAVKICLGLGEMLRTRFEQTRNETDLRSATDHHRALAERLPPRHPAAGPILVELAATLRLAFAAGGATADAEAAVLQVREVVTGPGVDPTTAIRA